MIKQGRPTRKQKQLINLLNRQHKLARQTNWQHGSNKVQLLTLNHRYYAQRLQNFACSILPRKNIHKNLPAVHIIPRLDKQLLAKSQFTMMQKRKTPHMHSAHITSNIHINQQVTRYSATQDQLSAIKLETVTSNTPGTPGQEPVHNTRCFE